MAKEKNVIGEFIEKLYPKHGELQVDEQGGIHTTIVDEEMDGFECKFNYDGCVEINTEGMSYIILNPQALRHLADLIEEAEEIYDNRTEEEWEKFRK